MVNNKYEK